MKRRIIALIAGAALLCGIAGCENTEGNVSAPESSTNSENSTSNVEQSSTAEPDSSTEDSTNNSSEPEESNTIQSVKAEIEMDGQLISLPCKVKDIKNITIDQEYSFAVVSQDDGSYMSSAYFFYNNIRAGGIFLEGDCSEISDLSEENVIGFTLNEDIVPMSYLGLTYNSNRDDIIAMFGEPDAGQNTYMCYYFGEKGSVSFSLNSSNRIRKIDIFLNIR